ncbi:hypothetical protein CVU82_01410 [Candidatus Falkowbacteria bacterium HGW-Falkowbacteria-1]|uniref:Methyltransferase type 11 domain-containing protein n=1 Tax=Candidatus Falkowbacteria bacterium HGW-Falkowbacteria-1 TaxID=2013768 RepID=A0A2N2EAU0_9BACT|nr:MAG: hypothetical protein CVU82_01410 [Candidatus Falkowbacteria bacterium HGW-Falkowbacteria-1]
MEKIESHKQNWEKLGEMDPLWAVLSDNSKRFNNWNLEEFLQTGEVEVENVYSVMRELNVGLNKGEVLDFGCGVGRLARHFLKHFDKYNGCDISKNMLERAKKINQDLSAEFFENGEDLKIFKDQKFDFIYSGIVLQHLPDKEMVKKYILEFYRVLKNDGLLVFQLPSKIPWRFRLQPVRKVYLFLKLLGLSDKFLYKQLGLYPIKMSAIEEEDMKNFLIKVGFKVLTIKDDSYCGPSVESRTYYCQK